jgi:hypothetical protein
VVYIPAAQDGRAASATTDAEGNYSLITNTDQGAMPGAYRVMVSQYVGKDGKPITQFQEGMDLTQLIDSGQAKQSLPPRYSNEEQAETRVEVAKDSDNEHKLELTSK